MTNGRTGAKGRRGMPPKKVGNGTKTSKDHIYFLSEQDLIFRFCLSYLFWYPLVWLCYFPPAMLMHTIITTETVSILSNVRQYLLYWVLQV